MNIKPSTPRTVTAKAGGSPGPIVLTARHPKSGLATSYRVTVDTVKYTEVIREEGTAAGLIARLTVQMSPRQRPVTIMASRLVGEKVWYSDTLIGHDGRVLCSRGFGNRGEMPRRLLADLGDLLSAHACGVPGLVEEAAPGRPLILAPAKTRRKAKTAAKA